MTDVPQVVELSPTDRALLNSIAESLASIAKATTPTPYNLDKVSS